MIKDLLALELQLSKVEFIRSKGKMSSRFKPYLFILLGILLVAILLNPPVAFASKLPTACNVFDKKQIIKSGPCGPQAMFSKFQSLEDGVVLISGAELGIRNFLMSWTNHSSFFSLSVIIPNSVPLRC
jgi:hypothetical protein